MAAKCICSGLTPSERLERGNHHNGMCPCYTVSTVTPRRLLYIRLKRAPINDVAPEWETTVLNEGQLPRDDGSIYRWHRISAAQVAEYNAIMSDYGQMVGRLRAMYDEDLKHFVAKDKPGPAQPLIRSARRATRTRKLSS